MGELETALYAPQPYGEADTLGRRILRAGIKIQRDCYRYRGQVYWVVDGRVLTREQAEALADERRREGRLA